jgi:hypothetical protein
MRIEYVVVAAPTYERFFTRACIPLESQIKLHLGKDSIVSYFSMANWFGLPNPISSQMLM